MPLPTNLIFGTQVYLHDITGSTVLLTCCKGEVNGRPPIFGPSQLVNPLTDFIKIWNRLLHRRCDPSYQICFFVRSAGTCPRI